MQLLRLDGQPGQHAAHHARVGQIDHRPGHTGGLEHVQRQFLHLQVGLQAGVAEDLGAELQRLTRAESAGARMQDRAAVAQPRHTLPIEQVRVDARGLRRGVGAQAQRAAAELVHQLEGAQIQLMARASEQRIQMFEQRRHDQLEAVAARTVEQAAPQFLDAARLRRQDIGNVLRQQPGRGHERGPGK